MKVELEGSLKKSLLKGWLWMDENGGSLEDGQDEASQKLARSTEGFRHEENGATSLFNRFTADLF
jgi:hypothetical protein